MPNTLCVTLGAFWPFVIVASLSTLTFCRVSVCAESGLSPPTPPSPACPVHLSVCLSDEGVEGGGGGLSVCLSVRTSGCAGVHVCLNVFLALACQDSFCPY